VRRLGKPSVRRSFSEGGRDIREPWPFR
jgi:hypothetical protein